MNEMQPITIHSKVNGNKKMALINGNYTHFCRYADLTELPNRLSTQNATDLIGKLIGIQRLAQEAIKAGSLCFVHLIRACFSSHSNDWNGFEPFRSSNLFESAI